MIRVMVCDDQEIVREGLRTLLATDPDIRVAGVASDGRALLEMAAADPPDLVLLDLKMPAPDGIRTAGELRRRLPAVRVLVLTTYDDEEWVLEAIRQGARGYLLKDTPRERLITAVKGTVRGETWVDPSVAGPLLSRLAEGRTPPLEDPRARLTERETDILRLIARGFSNGEIGRTLHLSEGTIRNHVTALFTKLEVADRTEAVVAALRQGLLELGEI